MSGLTLGIDTASLVSVGLARDGQVLAAEVVPDPRGHVEQLTPLIARVCADAGVRIADLDLIVVGLGPGPFTGLRVGIVTARTLALVSGASLHGVCSLDVIAAAHRGQGRFVVAADARRREVYWAAYDDAGSRVDGPYVSAPDALPDGPVVGPAVDLYPDRLAAAAGPRALDPGLLATVGPELPDAGRSPLYLRRPDAAVSTGRKSVLPRLRRPAGGIARG
jgi:tRNA threonylcarbamoyl adenosine modification protein YeaZ